MKIGIGWLTFLKHCQWGRSLKFKNVFKIVNSDVMKTIALPPICRPVKSQME
jgi:hypothetical protein